MIEKIDDKEMDNIAGGIELTIRNGFIKNESHDESWKKRIRGVAENFDAQKFHFCVCGACPGCGKMVGTAGDVCATCRQEAGCPSKKLFFK